MRATRFMELNEEGNAYGTLRGGTVYLSMGTATDFWDVSGEPGSAVKLLMSQEPDEHSYMLLDARTCHEGTIVTFAAHGGFSRIPAYFNGDLGLWVFAGWYAGYHYISMEEEAWEK